MNQTPVGKCSHCGKPAQWNTPALDPKGNLWCDHCKDEDRSGILFIGVNQYQQDGKYVPDQHHEIALNGVILWDDLTAWVDGGSRAVHLTEAEKKLSPLQIVEMLDIEHNINKLTRCTGCGKPLQQHEIAGYPLFAGVNCAPCWKKHHEHLDEERKRGHVCRMCGQPYGNCCC